MIKTNFDIQNNHVEGVLLELHPRVLRGTFTFGNGEVLCGAVELYSEQARVSDLKVELMHHIIKHLIRRN
jgi:hypothetical protein